MGSLVSGAWRVRAAAERCSECNGTPRTDHKLWCSERRDVKPLDGDSYDDAHSANGGE